MAIGDSAKQFGLAVIDESSCQTQSISGEAGKIMFPAICPRCYIEICNDAGCFGCNFGLSPVPPDIEGDYKKTRRGKKKKKKQDSTNEVDDSQPTLPCDFSNQSNKCGLKDGTCKSHRLGRPNSSIVHDNDVQSTPFVGVQLGNGVTTAFPSKDVCSSLDSPCAQVSFMSNESLGGQSCSESTDGEYLAQPVGCMVQCSAEANWVFEDNSCLPAQLGVQADPASCDAHDDEGPLWELQTARHSGSQNTTNNNVAGICPWETYMCIYVYIYLQIFVFQCCLSFAPAAGPLGRRQPTSSRYRNHDF